MHEISQRAEQFLEQQGRAIDRARFAYHFAAGSLEQLASALAPYQNEDGGWHGLEVDIKTPASNPVATELALSICLQAGLPRDHELLQRTVSYLEANQQADGGWQFAPAVYQHELAPWFANWQFPNLNPSCTTAGLLRQLGLGSAALHAKVEALFQQLANPLDLAGEDFYAARPYAYYFAADWQHPQRDFYRAGVYWWLLRQHLAGKLDGEHFFAYMNTPEHYAARMMPASVIAEHLDQLVAEQAEDGGWPSPYNSAWRPWTTTQNLLTLKAFGKI